MGLAESEAKLKFWAGKTPQERSVIAQKSADTRKQNGYTPSVEAVANSTAGIRQFWSEQSVKGKTAPSVEVSTSMAHKFIFLAYNGPGPYSCSFCDESVRPPWVPGNKGEALQVHHLNHDHNDNDPANLAAAHGKCHASYHFKLTWERKREEISSKLSLNAKARWEKIRG